MRVARELVKTLYSLPAGTVLRSHRGDFYHWDAVRYVELDRRDVRRRAYEYLEDAVYLHPKDGWVPFAPTERKIADVLGALHACVGIESFPDAPLWIDRRESPPAPAIVAMTNGLLDVRTRILHPHTPQFFTHHALSFDFDPKAVATPRWTRFLKNLWPDDDQAIASLQEIIGYLLAGDTRQQKAFLIVGPKRGGKGTIGRVVTGLLGAHNVAAPTLASLATNFGLSPLIGKPLALISDARLSGRADSKVVVERLLSISGEDSLTIDRKYRDPWTGRLPTRFLVLSNELPKLVDASGALASRYIVLVLRQSFYGQENPQLTNELLAEAPAIFNWALEGLDRLLARGYFVNPDSAAEAIQQMEDLSSPIGAFIRDRCVIRPDVSVEVETLWKAWKAWCSETNTDPKEKAVFGRDLRAVLPTLKVGRPWESRLRRYVGISLREDYSADLPGLPGLDPDSSPASPGSPSKLPMYPSHGPNPMDEQLDRGDERFQKGWRAASDEDGELF